MVSEPDGIGNRIESDRYIFVGRHFHHCKTSHWIGIWATLAFVNTVCFTAASTYDIMVRTVFDELQTMIMSSYKNEVGVSFYRC